MLKIVALLQIFFRLEAILESDAVLKTNDIVNLTPLKGNVHSFKAITDTVILDILTPNYDQVYRFCNFYRELEPIGKALTAKAIDSRTLPGYRTYLQYLVSPPPNLNIVQQKYEGQSIH